MASTSKLRRSASSQMPGEQIRVGNTLCNLEDICKCDRIGDFRIGRIIGEGSFGKVMLGTDLRNKSKVALKFVDRLKVKEKSGRDPIMREINSLTRLKHENIICLKEVMEVTSNILCLVLEFAGGGELYDYIVERERLADEEAREFFRQIVLAVEHCHSKNIVHRDLKLENILLDENRNIKLADFGFSTCIQNGKQAVTSRCGSPMYAAPEVLSADPYIGPEVDIWALGVILFSMVTGEFPWRGADTQAQLRHAARGFYVAPDFLSNECKDLISKMLIVDKSQRSTIQEIKDHPWLTNTTFKVEITKSETLSPSTSVLFEQEIFDFN